MRPSQTDFPAAPSDLAWRVLGLLNLYRLLTPPVLVAIQAFTRPLPTIGGAHPSLFQVVCIAYFVAGVLLILLKRQRWGAAPSLNLLSLVHAVIDAVAVSLLLYASGGVSSGLGILLVVPIASTALLAPPREALLIAAIATIGVLVQQVFGQLHDNGDAVDYTTAGVIGVVLFLIVTALRPIANRLRESEALVKRQEIDLENLAQLSQYIVQHLRESLIVVDEQDRVRLINESAAQILGDSQAWPGALLGEASPKLLYLLETWRSNGAAPSEAGSTFIAADGTREIQPHFASLGTTNPPPVIVFLEDTSLLAAKVQQSKLAALGRLSASIAHEIRNPVGAMSHAAQLLGESPELPEGDKRLTDIIRTNADRVSRIIENVQSMSRRDPARTEKLSLTGWVREFRDDYCASSGCDTSRLGIVETGRELIVRCDPSQLRQIVSNLCDNALRHHRAGASPVEIRIGRLAPTQRPFLEVADRGPGISPSLAERIFEPFVTGESRGTGLGLFLARELAQANEATLIHEPRAGGGAVFRVVFSDPLRWAD